jgi:FAD/FMN-containing dehydrogenase
VGGFLLGGGFGWNFRAVGPSCMSVRAVDVVTADGELIRADEEQNADWLWAARGAGPGFFGVVTRFHLDLYEAPKALVLTTYLYSLDVLEELLTWAREVGRSLAPNLEFLIYASAHASPGQREPAVSVAGIAFAESEAEARELLAPLETCPVLNRALAREVEKPVTFDQLYALVGDLYPDGLRYAVDNMYTDGPAAEVVPAMRELFAHMPTPRSHVLWMNWSPRGRLPDMALSVQGDVYIAAYSVWEDDADTARCETWGIEQMRRLEPLSVGSQMSDENMAGRPSTYLSPQAAERLEELRALHDPGGVFHSFLT